VTFFSPYVILFLQRSSLRANSRNKKRDSAPNGRSSSRGPASFESESEGVQREGQHAGHAGPGRSACARRACRARRACHGRQGEAGLGGGGQESGPD